MDPLNAGKAGLLLPRRRGWDLLTEFGSLDVERYRNGDCEGPN